MPKGPKGEKRPKEPTKAVTHRRAKTPRPAPKKSTDKAVTKPYEPTPRERAAVDAMYARKKAKHPAPWVNVSKEGGLTKISLDHDDERTGGLLLMGAIGTTTTAFLGARGGVRPRQQFGRNLRTDPARIAEQQADARFQFVVTSPCVTSYCPPLWDATTAGRRPGVPVDETVRCGHADNIRRSTPNWNA